MRRKRTVGAEEVRDRIETLKLVAPCETACAGCGTTLLGAFNGSHKPRFARARALVWGVMRRAGLSYTEIGELCGYDHTNVITQVRAHCLSPRLPARHEAVVADAPVTWRAQDGDAVGLGALEGCL